MAKCKRCNQDDLTWDKENFEKTAKWRLWNPNTERPHECSKKKRGNPIRELNTNMKREGDNLWKKDWKPEMDLPSVRLCGVCNDGTLLIKNEKYWCDVCNKSLNQTCLEYCPKCEKHPNIIFVENKKENDTKKD